MKVSHLTTLSPFNCRVDDETNSKHGDADENDEEIRSTKDGEDRPSSSGWFLT
jgi:hypothetical protein